MRTRLAFGAAVLALAVAVPPAGAADTGGGSPSTEPTAEPRVVVDRTICGSGKPIEVLTDVSGHRADILEALQSEFEDAPGFRGVLATADGSYSIVVEPGTGEDWGIRASTAGANVIESCVDTSIVDEARKLITSLDYGSKDYSAAGYDVLLDAVSVRSSLALDAIKNAMSSAKGGNVETAIADRTLRIDTGQPGEIGRLGRLNDGSPFWGGAKVIIAGGGCSTGIYINSSTNGTAMVTAGHCGLNGNEAWNGNDTLLVGTMEGRKFPNPDLALIDGKSYSGKTYCGNDTTTNCSVTGWANPTTGVTYCNMGYAIRRACSAYSILNDDFCDSSGCTTNLAYTSRPCSVGALGFPGDSGGGVFRENSTGIVSARGTVVGGGTINGGATCVRDDTKIGTIWSTYDATLITP